MSACDSPIDVDQLRDWLVGENFVTRLHYLSETDSTNDQLKKLGAEGAAAGTVLISESQSAGRGRLGRSWHSPPYTGLYISILLRPTAQIAHWPRWTLAASVAAAEACRRSCKRSIAIKWPNDLTFEGRKLGGVLAEMRTPATGAGELVLGLGLNVRRQAAGFPGSLSETATSLEEIAGTTGISRERVAATYLREMGQIHRQLELDGWPQIARRWSAFAPHATDCRVRVAASMGGVSYHGTTAGLDPFGALIVIRDDDGERVAVRDACSITPLESC